MLARGSRVSVQSVTVPVPVLAARSARPGRMRAVERVPVMIVAVAVVVVREICHVSESNRIADC